MKNTEKAFIVQRLDNILSNMGEILDFVEAHDIGMDEDFCKHYPFEHSLDEVYYNIIWWRDSLDGEVN